MQLLESIRWTPQWRPISSNIVLYCVQRLICIYSWNTLLFAYYFLVNKYHIYTERNQVVSRVTPCYLQHPNCIVFKKVLNEKDELKLTNSCKLISVILNNFQVQAATNHVFVYFFLLFLISFHWWFTIMYYFYVYSKYVFMSLTDIPLYLVLYTFGIYLYFVFVYMDVFCFFLLLFLYTNPHSLVFW